MGTATVALKRLQASNRISDFQKKELLRRSVSGGKFGLDESRGMEQLGTYTAENIPEWKRGVDGFTSGADASVDAGYRTEGVVPGSYFNRFEQSRDAIRTMPPQQMQLPGVPRSGMPEEFPINLKGTEMKGPAYSEYNPRVEVDAAEGGGVTVSSGRGSGVSVQPGSSGEVLPKPGIVMPQSPAYVNQQVPYPRVVQEAGERVTPQRTDLIMTKKPGGGQVGESEYDRLTRAIPAKDVKLGRVSRIDANGEMITKDLPIEEARALVKSDPRWVPGNTPRIPPVTVTSRVASDSPENMIPKYARGSWDHGIKREKQSWTGVLTQTEKNTMDAVKRTADEMGLEISKEEVHTFAEKVIDILREIGSGRSSEVKFLDKLRKEGPSKNNPKLKDGKDYFTHIATMKREGQVHNRYKRESDTFDRIIENSPKAKEKWDKLVSEFQGRGK